MALISPGVEVTVIDQSQYLPSASSSVPLILLATAQDKINASGTAVAPATTAANANKLYLITSQRDLVNYYGNPYFYKTTDGTPIQGYELNEYGLLAAYSLLGITNQAYILRADVDLASLIGRVARPTGAPANGTYWLDSVNSTWGINEWNLSTGKFALKTPIVLEQFDQASNRGVPNADIGAIGDYCVNPLDYTGTSPRQFAEGSYFYKNAQNEWVIIGSTEWAKSWPTVQGTNAPTILTSGEYISINDVVFTVESSPNNNVVQLASQINNGSLAYVSATVVDGRLNIFSSRVTNGEAVFINLEGSAGLLRDLGMTAGIYYQPELTYAPNAQQPIWSAGNSPRPTGSVWVNVSAANRGSKVVMSKYDSSLAAFRAQSCPLYTSDWAATYGIDPTGGKSVPVGATYMQYTFDNELETGPVQFWNRRVSGPTIVVGGNTEPTFMEGAKFNVWYTVPNRESLVGPVEVVVNGTTAVDFVTSWSAANITNTVAEVLSTGAIQITHTAGGEIVMDDQQAAGVQYATVTSGGANYLSATVTFSEPDLEGGVRATGTAVVADGEVVSIAVTQPGSGYVNPPSVTITSTSGSGATATAALYSPVVAEAGFIPDEVTAVKSGPFETRTFVNVEDSSPVGSGLVTQVLLGFKVASVSIADGGTGFPASTTQNVVFRPLPAAGTAATGVATINSSGSVTSIAVTPGTGMYYTAPTQILIAGGGSGFDGTVVLESAETVGAVTIDNGGSGYTTAPSVTFTGGSGSGALASSVLGFPVASVGSVISDANFTSTPAVSFIGNGSGAVATATVGFPVSTLVTVLENGSDYASVPTVSITPAAGDSTGSGATATASIKTLEATMVAGGTGYSVGDTLHPVGGSGTQLTSITVDTIDSGVSAVNVTTVGTGYTTPPTVTLQGGTQGNAATASATTKVVSTQILNAGSGYTVGDVLTLDLASFGGSADCVANAQVTVNSVTPAVNAINSYTLTLNGSGYIDWSTLTPIAVTGGTGAGATFSVQMGLDAITVTSAGDRYTAPPTVLISGGGSGAAQAQITTAGPILTYRLTAAGNYTTAPTAVVDSAMTGGTGTGATFDLNMGVQAITVTNAGSGYTVAPVVSITGGSGIGGEASAALASTGGQVVDVTLVAPGSGYTSAPTVVFTGGGGTASATVTLSAVNGKVVEVVLQSGGTGYVTAPSVTIEAPFSGTTATATAHLETGGVVSVAVLDGGENYTDGTIPVVFTPVGGGSGTGASAIATVVDGTVADIVVTAPGSGYAAAPTASINGAGTGAIFDITVRGFTTTPLIINGGSGYEPNDLVLIKGSDIGGVSPSNDITYRVLTVNSSSEVTSVAFVSGLAPATFRTQLSNWVPFDYIVNDAAPRLDPANNTNWYWSVVDQVDIMTNYQGEWYGYRNRNYGSNGLPVNTGSNQTDPNGPLVMASEPTTQSDGTPLVYGDLWIDTSDLENYPVIYRWQSLEGLDQWVLIDNTDQITQNGVVFADARWATNGTTDPVFDAIPTIKSLLSSNYLDLDAPNAALYPQGTLLFNTRRSGYNVKQFRVNYFNGFSFPDATLPTETNAWVSVSGLMSNGAPYMGRKAQRAVVVDALQASIQSNTDIRVEDNFFNLIATPNYPELQPQMITLNGDRNETAYVVGDTPLRLPEDATSIANWAQDTAGASATGEEGLVTRSAYMGLYYPSGMTTDLQGSDVVVPSSHMMLRTILRNDQIAYPWFAPAGARRGLIDNASSIGYLNGQTGEYVPTKTRIGIRDVCYQNQINPLTFFTGTGLLNYGNLNSQDTQSALNRTNVARLVAFLRRQLTIAARPFIFEPNDITTRNAIKGVVESLLADIMAKRGIYDYLVVCDGSNNTPARIDRNELWIDVAIEPVKAVEFIYIPIRILNTGEISGLNQNG